MDTKEPKIIADVLKHNWELGSGGAGPIGGPSHVSVSPAYDLLRQMSENLLTQENAGTADPMFVVFQKQLVAGFEAGYEDFWIWVALPQKPRRSANFEAGAGNFEADAPGVGQS